MFILVFHLQKVLTQVLQEAGYTRESYLTLDDFVKVFYVLLSYISCDHHYHIENGVDHGYTCFYLAQNFFRL